MRISTLTLIASALTTAGIALAPAAHAGPTVEQLCDAQSWPRPVPDVVGTMFERNGALACWNDVRGVDAAIAFNTITAVSPAPGTLVGRDDPITVALAPTDYDAPPSYQPCDWVTTTEVADIFGIAGPIKTDGFVPPGSVEPHCTYRSPGHTAVATTLYVTGAFPVDAAAEYSMYSGESASQTTEISGLGVAARCLTNLHGAQDSRYNEVVVLLDGNRLFKADGLGAQPCDQLQQFATTAISRI